MQLVVPYNSAFALQFNLQHIEKKAILIIKQLHVLIKMCYSKTRFLLQFGRAYCTI